MELSTSLRYLPGVGPALSAKLARLNLSTVEDLINHYPFRYDDFSNKQNLSQVKAGETVTLKGELWSIKNVYTRFRKALTQAVFNDGSGTIEIIWFNQPWLTKNLKTGDKLQVSGKINRKGNKLTLVAPVWEKIPDLEISASTVHTGRLTPVYPETANLSSKWLRQKIARLLPVTIPHIKDPLPEFVQDDLLPLTDAIRQIHFPDNLEQAKVARERLAFDELFYVQLLTLKRKQDWQQYQTVKPLKINQKKIDQFIADLPFELTSAQKKVIGEIINDFKKDHPMNRLLQGDVGSGKTVVAATIIYLLSLNKLRSILMAPTEILAFQHHQTLTKLLSPFGIEVGIYTGSRKNIKAIPSVVVGTHALLSDKLDLPDVGLIVVDEQHKFGVEQRGLIRKKARIPHFLTMTATPIPRTVALTLYGDLDLSIIDQMPVGRKVVRTHFVPHKKRVSAYKFITGHIQNGEQVYIITPLIEPSETLISAKAAKVEYERLKKAVFPQFKLGLLHGRLKSKEKEQVINDFKNGLTNILVSTSVVEVGVDVPNATIMVIEGAERFGLAQLHQLRGRVGRSTVQSYALLFTEQENLQVVNRLKNLENIFEGLKLAELDLKIRGSGEIFGTAQSGEWNLKIASLSDLALIEKTRLAAQKILDLNPILDKYPLLAAKLDTWGKEIFPD